MCYKCECQEDLIGKIIFMLLMALYINFWEELDQEEDRIAAGEQQQQQQQQQQQVQPEEEEEEEMETEQAALISEKVRHILPDIRLNSWVFCANFYFNDNFGGMLKFNAIYPFYAWLSFLAEGTQKPETVKVLIHEFPEPVENTSKFFNLKTFRTITNLWKFKCHPRFSFSIAQLPPQGNQLIPIMSSHLFSYCELLQGQCVYYHMCAQALEITLCGEWMCLGPLVYISLPRLMKTCNDIYYKIVLILDKQFGNFIFISQNQTTKKFQLVYKKQTTNHLLFEQCFENLPDKFEDNNPVSLSAFCYQTIWKYDLLKRTNHSKLLKNLIEIEPYLEQILNLHYKSLYLERKIPKLSKLRKEGRMEMQKKERKLISDTFAAL